MPEHRGGTALFESWRGRYADGPRALSESMPEALGLRRLWVGVEGTQFPEDVAVVRRHSPDYFRRLATSRLVVANDIISRHLVKGPRTRYVQLWHGTPLKRIGFDESHLAYAGARGHLHRMRRDIAKWDYLVSSSPTCTELFRQAFGYSGEVLETGSPHNDALRSPEAAAVRDRVRAELGLSPGTTAVLYAPTWRDDQNLAGGGFEQQPGFEVARLRALLPESVVVLARMHRNVAHRPEYEAPGFVLDVSEHPSVSELYLAADVLVSDYSSVVFDFAVTRKPIVLFPYDLGHYERTVRGLYFDYATWAPGPVVETTDELGAALLVAMAPVTAAGPAYAAFVDRFCPWDDGQASQRVWQALLR